jgi:hydrogenase/urease accessory protein HupE
MIMRRRLFLCLLALLALASSVAQADIFRPAYLEIRERGGDRYEVLWKVPAAGENMRLAMNLRLPADARDLSPRNAVLVGGAYVERWQIERTGGLVGQAIVIEGLATGVSDVIARVERSDGTTQVERLGAGRLSFVVEPPQSALRTAWTYLKLGVEHILGGVDHLLFVLALLLIVRDIKRIVATVTAFTVAHSLTLVAATMGWVHVAGPPVEACIALSIVFVAAEIIRGQRGHPGLTARAPWIVAFSFGLLHGFGFAGALAEVGLPQSAIPVALLCFNLGVEIGQLMFVASVLILIALWKRLPLKLPAWAPTLAPYAIGGVAMFWVFERIAAF